MKNNTELFYRNIDLAINVAKQFGVYTLLFTGKGEPLYDELLANKIYQLNKNNDFIIEIQTNGVLLKERLKVLLSNASTIPNTIAISMVDFDRNKEIMGENALSFEGLKERIELCKKHDINIRLTFVCMKGFNDTLEKIYQTIFKCQELGVDQVTFRLMGMPRNTNRNIFNYCVDNIINKMQWNSILESINSEKQHELMSIYDWGSVSWIIAGLEVLFAKCLTNPSKTGKIRNLIYDGHMRKSWEYPKALIF